MLVDCENAHQLLAARVALECDLAAREAMLTALAGSRDAAAARTLAQLLRSQDAGLRNAVVDTLGQMPATAAIAPELLADEDAGVRVLTVMLLSALR